MADSSYAGDLSPREAWSLLESDRDSVLVDVRTEPEWRFVGVPDLGRLGRSPVFVSWQVAPTMNINQDFVSDVRRAGVGPDQKVIFICRSGGRSRSAAIAATAAGFRAAYNLAGGFEGALDEQRHRGSREGWKADGLPWAQE